MHILSPGETFELEDKLYMVTQFKVGNYNVVNLRSGHPGIIDAAAQVRLLDVSVVVTGIR